MINTYSVIIQNKMTAEAFKNFQPLFLEALDDNRIGICRWNESGTTIDTAVPELRDLTNDKEEWQAFIIRFEDGRTMSDFQTREQNPYDFCISDETEECFEESSVPLIRLTHMLGDIPKPEIKFVCERIFENGKAVRTVYKPVEDENKKAAYQALCKKYEYDGVLPSSIVIITVREGVNFESTVESAWKYHSVGKSSEFWKRNKYPSNCRFIVYDFEKKGPIQRNADEFGFWLSVMLLATNEVTASVLQAYKLYNLKLKINKKQMEECFQKTATRLETIKYLIEKEIRKDIEAQICFESELPEYKLNIPVAVSLPLGEDRSIDESKFGLFSQGANSELGTWHKEKEQVEQWLDISIRRVQRTLDQTASRIRYYGTFSEDEISGLDIYQEEDLMRETDNLYREIVEMQGKIPLNEISEKKEVKDAEEKVSEYLKGRVTQRSAIWAIIIIFILIVIGNIPAIINKREALGYVLLFALLEFVVIVFAGLMILFIQKKNLQGLLEQYNLLIQLSFGRLTKEADIFSKYLSSITSYMRGCSYLNLSKRKKRQVEDAHYMKYRYMRIISVFLAKIKMWSIAYHLNLNFDERTIDESIDVNEVIKTKDAMIYTFDWKKSYSVEINKSGESMESPFCFIEGIEIVKEELYDDKNS